MVKKIFSFSEPSDQQSIAVPTEFEFWEHLLVVLFKSQHHPRVIEFC